MTERTHSTVLQQVHADLLLDVQKLLLETQALKKEVPDIYKAVSKDVESAAKIAHDAFKDMEYIARGLAVHTNKAKSDFESTAAVIQSKINDESKANAKAISAGFSPFTKHLWLLSAVIGTNLLLTVAFGIAHYLR